MLWQKCRVTIFSVSKLQIILISCAIVVTVSRLGHKYVIPVTRDKRSAQCQQNPELCQHVSFIIETSSVCYSYARVNRTEENINNEKICRPAERERERTKYGETQKNHHIAATESNLSMQIFSLTLHDRKIERKINRLRLILRWKCIECGPIVFRCERFFGGSIKEKSSFSVLNGQFSWKEQWQL